MKELYTLMESLDPNKPMDFTKFPEICDVLGTLARHPDSLAYKPKEGEPSLVI